MPACLVPKFSTTTLCAAFSLFLPLPSNSIKFHQWPSPIPTAWSHLGSAPRRPCVFFRLFGRGLGCFPRAPTLRLHVPSANARCLLAVCSLCSLFPSVCSLFASVFPPACARLPPLALLFSAAASAPPPGKKPLSWATGDRPEARELPLESKSSTLICGLLHCNVTISLEEHQPPVNLNPIA